MTGNQQLPPEDRLSREVDLAETHASQLMAPSIGAAALSPEGHSIRFAPIGQTDERMMSTPEALDGITTLQELQRRYVATGFVKQWFEMPDLTPMEKEQRFLGRGQRVPAERINNQFAARILPTLVIPDRDRALEAFRTIQPHTDDELLVTLTNDTEFTELHTALGEHLATNEDAINAEVAVNQARIERIDKTQFPDKPTLRSLEAIRQNGLTLRVRPGSLQTLQLANAAASSNRPLIEYLKNERVLDINGLDESKISLAVHDFMDHAWTFALIQDAGLLDKYADMFASIGNPQDFDIYKREGEIVASIAYGVREYETIRPGFEPLIDTSQIADYLDGLFVEDKLDISRHIDALRILKGLKPGSLEWQSIGFGFSSYITELDEQRRKHGTIKQRDPQTGTLLGELDPYSPDFLCFFIETLHQVIRPKNFHYNDLARFHVLLEDYLVGIASGRVKDNTEFSIKLSDLRNVDFSTVQISADRIQWIREHYGFATARYAIV